MSDTIASSAPALKCPVCQAKFRGTAVCSRCGTDLTPLMRIAAKAWSARRQSVEALRAGNLSLALRLSAQARKLHRVDVSGSQG